MKDPHDIRNRQICLYFSENEKTALDNLCRFYFNSSRADFVRIAMYIAVNEPEIFLDAGLKAGQDGILTRASNRRLK